MVLVASTISDINKRMKVKILKIREAILEDAVAC